MGMLALVLLAVPLPAAEADALRDPMRKSLDLLLASERNEAKMLFVKRRETRELDASGAMRSKEVTTLAREPYEDIVITRVVARNDQPLSAAEKAKQDEEIRKNVADWRARKTATKPPVPAGARKPNEMEAMIREFPNATECRKIGSEKIAGHDVDIIEFQPRAGYKPPNMKARAFEKMRGKFWVDRESAEVVKVEAEIFDDLSFGFGVLGKLGKGTQFGMERREVAPGIWLSTREHARFQARFMLVKSFRQEIESTYSEFRPRPIPTQAARVR